MKKIRKKTCVEAERGKKKDRVKWKEGITDKGYEGARASQSRLVTRSERVASFVVTELRRLLGSTSDHIGRSLGDVCCARNSRLIAEVENMLSPPNVSLWKFEQGLPW